jgi:hypothetical protein
LHYAAKLQGLTERKTRQQKDQALLFEALQMRQRAASARK